MPPMFAAARRFRPLVVALLLATNAPIAQGQGDGGGDGGGGGGGDGGDDTDAGVTISAAGFVTAAVLAPVTKGLDADRVESFLNDVDGDLNRPSLARKVSLTRLARFLADGGEIDPAVARLAGLQRVDRLILSPDGEELVLVGPAEPFAPGRDGSLVGAESGRPPLRLADFAEICRALLAGERKVGCSLDVRADGLAALQRWLRSNSSPAPVGVVRRRYRTMTQVLGPHDVVVHGVANGTGTAARIVAADYLMKLISIGLVPARVRGVPSHLAMLRPGANAIQRWWFVPRYEAIERSESAAVFAFRGPRLELLSEAEKSNAGGKMSPVSNKPVSVERFSSQFSEHLEDLAARHRVFAELQNVVDLTLIAALLLDRSFPVADPALAAAFADRSLVPRESVPVMNEAATVANTKQAGRGLVIGLVGGGVTLRPRQALRVVSVPRDGGPTEVDRATAIAPEGLERWWWD